MAPRLDTIPLDILQHIAYLSALGSSANPPIDLLHLLLTNSTIYRSLRLRSNPHLYANIFCSVFDFCRSMDHVTASNIAAEFVCRHRFLRRVRRLDFSIEELTQDLWAAVRMILESNGANQMHLITVNFSAFLIDLSQLIFANYPGTEELDLKTVIVWLLCLSISQKDISHTPIALRGKFVKWIHPFISPSHEKQVVDSAPNSAPLNIPAFRGDPSSNISDGPQESTIDSWQHEPMIPDPSFAAINLTFAFKEAELSSMLLHAVSETRALAAVAHQAGPTMEDFRVFQSFRTPLCADTLSQEAGLMRSLEHDPEFRCLMTRRPDANHLHDIDSYAYVPGTLTGVWQGTYLTAIPVITPSTPAHLTPRMYFDCRKPIQCSLSEYLCFGPNIPVPWEDDTAEWTPRRLLEQEDGSNILSQRYNYERFEKYGGRRDSREALDIFIVGETLEDHDLAWGGFLFAGRVQRDGSIVMKREPKDPDQDYLGTWVFEGRLTFSKGFVGRWRSSSSRDIPNAQGIFSMAKISK